MARKKYNIDKEQLIEDYKNGLTVEELVVKYAYPKRYVLRDTQDFREKRFRATKEDIELVLKLYDSGLDQNQIAKETGFNNGTIGDWVRKYGNPRHRGPKSKIKNEGYFDLIDTEEKAYFLGWIMADGCVSTYNNEYSLKLAVATIDEEIIAKFLSAIQASYSISRTTTTGKHGKILYRSYVSCTSKHLVCALMNLGVIERKTGCEVIPKNIPDSLIPHFIRGFFDGDGITNNTKINKRSGFISSYEMLTGIQENLGTNQTIFRHPKSVIDVYYFLGGVEFSRILYQYMYKNATIWLSRKRERMELICKGYGNTEITEISNMFQYCNA